MCQFEIDAIPWKTGQTTILAVFNSNELYDLTGVLKVSVIAWTTHVVSGTAEHTLDNVNNNGTSSQIDASISHFINLKLLEQKKLGIEWLMYFVARDVQ